MLFIKIPIYNKQLKTGFSGRTLLGTTASFAHLNPQPVNDWRGRGLLQVWGGGPGAYAGLEGFSSRDYEDIITFVFKARNQAE